MNVSERFLTIKPEKKNEEDFKVRRAGNVGAPDASWCKKDVDVSWRVKGDWEIS